MTSGKDIAAWIKGQKCTVTRADVQAQFGGTTNTVSVALSKLMKQRAIYGDGRQGGKWIYSGTPIIKKGSPRLKPLAKLPDYPAMWLWWGGWTNIRPAGYRLVQLEAW